MSFITRIVTNLLLERPARKKDYAAFVKIYETKGRAIQDKLGGAQDNEKNNKTLSHIIGIERWGQSRLRVAMGDPFIDEEYDVRHRPARDTSWSDLKSQFAETRAGSVALIREFSAENIPASTKIAHNQFGEVSIGAWLQYLQFHASTEARGIK
ncbi:MAG: DinB family protein [Candidatus Promineifilaceae bacterium]